MRKKTEKFKNVKRGVPSAVLLSAAIHILLLFVAGGFVVFTVIKTAEKKFVPPKPVAREKMELRKPRVKVKKISKPRASSRITAKNISQAIPQIALPESSFFKKGGLSGSINDFEMMPDPSELTLLGGKNSVSIGNDLEGTFYSLSLDRRGKRSNVSEGNFPRVMRGFFVDSDWNPRYLAKYYRWPQRLYTTFIFIPTIGFEHVPRSFGIPDEICTDQWIVLYKGRIMAHETGRYRFWGGGNHVCAVKVDGKVVAHLGIKSIREQLTDWMPDAPEYGKYYTGKIPMNVGNWFELEANKPVDIEIVIGDHNGADTQATIRIQQEGKKYRRNSDGGPILPLFKTAEIPEHLKDEIRYLTMEDDQDLDDGPTFNVY